MANPSRICILRPVATTLLMAALFLSGLLAYRSLPVAALPEIDYPTIQVVTLYPGAGPQVVMSGITAPLERQFGQMPGLNQMSSQSSAGASAVTLRFVTDMSLDVAEQQVQAAINAAGNLLPSDLPSPPVYNKVNPADPPIMTLAVTSSVLPLPKLQDLVDTRLAQKISQISGVGLVTLAGGKRPAVRVSVDPRMLASYGLTLEDVRTAVGSANVNIAKGGFDGPERSSTLNANDQLQDADEYRRLILGWKNGSPVYLDSVADVADGVENEMLAAWYDTAPAIIVNIQRQPGANIIKTADEIKSLLPRLRAALPTGVTAEILTDRTLTTRSTVEDVRLELMLAVALVIGIMFLFLRSGRATLIPGAAVPLSLIGTFGVMYFLGYSINNLTLMALTIATGFVVDDAIVVVENINRYLEKGMHPLEAAITGAGQIGFTIISLTVSLVAVLIPLLFMGDVVGRLFREFAVTLAASILISAVISLTLTPMMCAYLLKPLHAGGPEHTPRFWTRVMEWYGRALDLVLAHQPLVLFIAAATLAVTVLLYVYVPKGFFPVQDTGLLTGITEGEQSAAFQSMAERQNRLAELILQDEAVESLSSFIGADGVNPGVNSGRISINLKPLSERKDRAPAVVRRLMDKAAAVPGIRLYLQPVQDLTIEDRVSRTQYQFTMEALTRADLEEWVPKLLQRLVHVPAIKDAADDMQEAGKEAFLKINRDRAASLGVTVSAIDNALYNAYGQRMISTIFTQTNQYRVILEVKPEYRLNPESLKRLYVPGANGSVVPLSAIASVEEREAPLVITRQGQFPSATISFNLAPGYGLGTAVEEIQKAARETHLPVSVPIAFQGAAKAFQSSLSGTLWLILAAVITMYIVLGVLYEHAVHPVTILSTLPSAGAGALLSLMLCGMDLGIVGIIGIILLIGIVKKNAIMMIDFALDAERREGKTPVEAIRQACLLRLRPILMTTLAALFGALPLMLGQGMGAELRRPLGVTMIGGLLVSQVLTLFTTPVIYLAFDRLSRRKKKARAEASEPASLPEA